MASASSRAKIATALIAGLGLVAVGCSAPSSAPAASPSGVALTGAAAGKVIFERSCASCHGATGEGSKFTMDKNTIEVPAITQPELAKMYGDKFDSLAHRAITQGLDEDGKPLNRMMPRWTIFSDKELNELIAYLKTLQ